MGEQEERGDKSVGTGTGASVSERQQQSPGKNAGPKTQLTEAPSREDEATVGEKSSQPTTIPTTSPPSSTSSETLFSEIRRRWAEMSKLTRLVTAATIVAAIPTGIAAIDRAVDGPVVKYICHVWENWCAEKKALNEDFDVLRQYVKDDSQENAVQTFLSIKAAHPDQLARYLAKDGNQEIRKYLVRAGVISDDNVK
jgi:hypothetical protein